MCVAWQGSGLIAIGASGSAAKPRPRLKPELRRTAPMSVARAAPVALLHSGRVLVAGGCTLPGCDDVEGFTATTWRRLTLSASTSS